MPHHITCTTVAGVTEWSCICGRRWRIVGEFVRTLAQGDPYFVHSGSTGEASSTAEAVERVEDAARELFNQKGK